MSSRRAVWKEPLGVVGAITPWNYPFEVTINKVGQILATGNTMVLKPAPDTPWNATRLGRLIAEKTDIPPGVVNVVTSSDHLVGEELTLSPRGRHDLVHRLDGDRQADHGEGRGHAQAGVPRARRQVGADRARRRRLPVRSCRWRSIVCMHAGQGCAMQTRLLLPRSRYDEGVELITAGMSQLPVRRPAGPGQHDGPADQREAARPRARLHRQGPGGGRHAGARRRPPGAPAEGLVRRADAVHRRRQLDDDRPGGDLRPGARRHPLRRRRRRRADRQRQRLRAVGWRCSPAAEERATAIARRIRTGSIGVNGGVWYGADSPYGGYKTSGIGRQNGIEGFEQHLETKTVAWPGG